MSQLEINKLEEGIQKFWKDRDIFRQSVENRSKRKRFVYWEGPPTANGKPGIHHLIGRAFKDLFPRYKTMRGYYVLRRAGWDTQGLPVEIEVEKKLGLKGKKDIEEYGIAAFNKQAKENVWEYLEEWQRFTPRMGFWIDLNDRYVTYENEYLESLWHIIQQFDKKGLLYEGYKVLPWCTRCGTALSSHEVAEGYEDVTDNSVYIKFKVKDPATYDLPENTYLTAWTTTPWTLPGNLALAVGKKIEYVVAKVGNEHLIVAKNRVEILDDHEVVKTLKGVDLLGIEYEPLFDIKLLKSETSYKVYEADFVTTEDGTGIVHTAVMYGEDDYNLGKEIGLPQHHTVDVSGKFTKDVPELSGMYVKADKTESAILAHLSKNGLLIKKEPYTHSYPHCWRCKTPLLYYARDSWFVAMSTLRKQLVANNKKVNWIPSHLRDGRFGEFIKEAKDWAFSRERYWGTPLPVWECTDCDHKLVIGSLNELEENRRPARNTFYAMRHGMSDKNSERGIIEESTVSSTLEGDVYNITEKGIKQSEDAAKRLKKEGGIDIIYASPFLRTQQTAKIIGDVLGAKVITDDRIREFGHGNKCEGKTHKLCPHMDYSDFDYKIEGGESRRELKKRMVGFIQDVEAKNEGKRILIISHGDPLWVLRGFAACASNAKMIEKFKTLFSDKGELVDLPLKNYPFDENGDVDMHRPYIDAIELACSECNGTMKRVKEVVDVWFDSGAMPYAQWHYPFENKDLFKDNTPSDFIVEGIDQTRGWFYTLLAVSTALGNGAPYKNVMSYGHVLDKKGKKMSKSVGNVVDPWEVMKEYGADAARWYFYTVNSPGDSKLFSKEDVQQQLRGIIMTLLNSLRFFELYSTTKTINPVKTPKPSNVLDRWILSRLHSVIQQVTEALDEFNSTSASRTIESFVVDDFSNWWIRRSRPRFQRPDHEDDLQDVLEFYRYIFIEITKLLAPFTPFIAEHIYRKLSNNKESVHLEDWPEFKKKYRDTDLELNMVELRDAVADGLAQRKTQNIKVRQPLASISLKTKFDPELNDLLIEELNVKEVMYSPDMKTATKLDTEITKELQLEGSARDVARSIQNMRKEAGFGLSDKIFAYWTTEDSDVTMMMVNFGEKISQDTLLAELNRGHDESKAFDIQKEFKLGNATIWIGLKK